MNYTSLFSPTELKVLRMLGKKKMTITEVAKKYFSRSPQHVFDPNAVVYTAIRRINKKCEFHQLPFFINGVGIGRGGRTVWKDKRE